MLSRSGTKVVFDGDTRGYENAMRRAGIATRNTRGSLEKLRVAVARLRNLFLLGAFSAGAVRVLRDMTDAWDAQAKAVAKVEQAIKSTGATAKLSLQTLQYYASTLQSKTLFGDEEIMEGAIAQLLTFTNIAGENFKRTVESALNLSTVLGTDLKSSAIQLGKALNDPIANLSALGRSGIQFSKEQKTLIKYLAETNRLAEAQAIILDELEKQYGGQAEAAAKAGMGGLTQLKNVIGDTKEQVGFAIANFSMFGTSLSSAISKMNAFRDELWKLIDSEQWKELTGRDRVGLIGQYRLLRSFEDFNKIIQDLVDQQKLNEDTIDQYRRAIFKEFGEWQSNYWTSIAIMRLEQEREIVRMQKIASSEAAEASWGTALDRINAALAKAKAIFEVYGITQSFYTDPNLGTEKLGKVYGDPTVYGEGMNQKYYDLLKEINPTAAQNYARGFDISKTLEPVNKSLEKNISLWDSLTVSTNEWVIALTDAGEVAINWTSAFEGLTTSAISGFAKGIGELATGKGGLESLFDSMNNMVGDFMVRLGEQMVAIGVSGLELEAAISKWDPALAIAAGAALIAAGSALSGVLSGGVSGGTSPGGTSTPAVINVEVSGKLRGEDIYLSNQRTADKIDRTG